MTNIVVSATIGHNGCMMPKKIAEKKLEAWRSFLETHALVMRRLEAELQEETGLPLAWFDVLYQISQAPDQRLRMQELAQKLLISRSGFTRLSDRMEGAGLIERTACPTDRRGIFVVLTPAGEEALTEAMPIHVQGIARHFADPLDDNAAIELKDALDRIRTTTEAAPRERPIARSRS